MQYLKKLALSVTTFLTGIFLVWIVALGVGFWASLVIRGVVFGFDSFNSFADKALSAMIGWML